MQRLMLLIAALALGGCMTNQQRMEKAAADYGPICSTMAAQGTPEWGRCVVTMYQQQRDRDVAAGAAMIGAGAAMNANNSRPAPVTCFRNGAYTTCQ